MVMVAVVTVVLVRLLLGGRGRGHGRSGHNRRGCGGCFGGGRLRGLRWRLLGLHLLRSLGLVLLLLLPGLLFLLLLPRLRLLLPRRLLPLPRGRLLRALCCRLLLILLAFFFLLRFLIFIPPLFLTVFTLIALIKSILVLRVRLVLGLFLGFRLLLGLRLLFLPAPPERPEARLAPRVRPAPREAPASVDHAPVGHPAVVDERLLPLRRRRSLRGILRLRLGLSRVLLRLGRRRLLGLRVKLFVELREILSDVEHATLESSDLLRERGDGPPELHLGREGVEASALVALHQGVEGLLGVEGVGAEEVACWDALLVDADHPEVIVGRVDPLAVRLHDAVAVAVLPGRDTILRAIG